MQRPAALPGVQSQQRLGPLAGCTNDTSAPLMQRCWSARGIWGDMAMFGVDTDAYGSIVQGSYYYAWLVQAYYICEITMTQERFFQLGAVGCFKVTVGNAGRSSSGPSPPPAAPRPPHVAEAPAGGGAGGGHRGALFGGVLGGVLGGPPSERQQQQLLLVDAQKRADSRCPLPVTPLTPVAPGVNLNLQYNPAAAAAAGRDAEGGGGGGGAARPEVELLGTTLGVGASGRVVLGAYRGERVAVKILNVGLWDAPAAAAPGYQNCQANEPPAAQHTAGPAAAAIDAIVAAAAAAKAPAPAPAPAPALPSGCAYGDTMSRESSAAMALGAGLGCAAAAGWKHAAGDGGRQASASQSNTDSTGTMTAAARMLGQEVEVLARCQHPNVIRLLAASLNGPRACLVMELMESSLDRMLYGGGGGGKEPRVLPLPTVLHIALQVAQALAYLHPTILHRGKQYV
ncbi:hypothetical protein GPECTOR_27g648 [Gonium pectorale]|uniref:Protein kinase domain-containing protein n=1 Tax=Gonium pectorale TaxID=33097 RepID=A0A150GF82_GONPE|nr:hypothetical protein GPECTOR_27g648 [Gonium pectorale]|eukprot:KXZ48478.1 hypothetical protein GPECTOR_27g648 [Gonium pectorale]